MTIAKHKPATYADLEAVPPNLVAEIIFGELVTRKHASLAHSAAITALSAIIGRPCDLAINGPGGWTVVYRPEVHLESHVIVPEIAGWHNERLAGMNRESHPAIAPDWVCDSSCPMIAEDVGQLRRAVYAQFGTSHLWFIDPPS